MEEKYKKFLAGEACLVNWIQERDDTHIHVYREGAEVKNGVVDIERKKLGIHVNTRLKIQEFLNKRLNNDKSGNYFIDFC